MSLRPIATDFGIICADSKNVLWIPVETIAEMLRVDKGSVSSYLERTSKIYSRRMTGTDGKLTTISVAHTRDLLAAAAQFRPSFAEEVARVGLMPYLGNLTGIEIDNDEASVLLSRKQKALEVTNHQSFGTMLTVDDMLERLQMELPKSMKNECGRILSLIMEQKGLERQQTRKRIRDAKGNYQSYPMNLYPVEYLPAFKTIAETIIEASR